MAPPSHNTRSVSRKISAVNQYGPLAQLDNPPSDTELPAICITDSAGTVTGNTPLSESSVRVSNPTRTSEAGDQRKVSAMIKDSPVRGRNDHSELQESAEQSRLDMSTDRTDSNDEIAVPGLQYRADTLAQIQTQSKEIFAMAVHAAEHGADRLVLPDWLMKVADQQRREG
jgi:hypothetical protein